MFMVCFVFFFFFFQAEDGIRDVAVTGVQTCALPILRRRLHAVHVRQGQPDPGVARLRAVLVQPREHATAPAAADADTADGLSAYRARSEERRVGKEARSRWSPEHEKKLIEWRRGIQI